MAPRTSIAHRRLANQLVNHTRFDDPAQVVGWLGAVQAQDYLGALWAVGLRAQSQNERQVEQALENGTIVRTWPMRGTLHFVAAADVRWMLQLLTPRVIAGTALRYRQLELDAEAFSRSRKTVVRVLRDGRRLERRELYQMLEKAHISTAGQRGIHILGRLAQEGVICFGPRSGKQPTFVLLDEWVAESKLLERKAALAELARRYFCSHGPAMVQDFAWWAGLSASDAREGVDLARSSLEREHWQGREYWFGPTAPASKTKGPTTFLLPGFDEYLVAYKDRSDVLAPKYVLRANAGGGILHPTIVVNGQVVGTWKRTLAKGAVIITPDWFASPSPSNRRALAAAAERYGAFLGLPAEVREQAR